MKIVLDTNVLVAAFIAHGACHELLEHCAIHHELVLSAPILNELTDVLACKFGFSAAEARDAAGLLRSKCAIAVPGELAVPVSRDPDDDMILATAVAGGCRCIVSGDKDLTVIGEYRGIRIVAPPDFWRFEEEMAGEA